MLLSSARVGLSFQVPRALEQVVWFGLGPHETYPDRKKSGLLGVHTAHVKDLYTPYVVPSENGGRSEVRWAALTDKAQKTGEEKGQRDAGTSQPDSNHRAGFP